MLDSNSKKIALCLTLFGATDAQPITAREIESTVYAISCAIFGDLKEQLKTVWKNRTIVGVVLILCYLKKLNDDKNALDDRSSNASSTVTDASSQVDVPPQETLRRMPSQAGAPATHRQRDKGRDFHLGTGLSTGAGRSTDAGCGTDFGRSAGASSDADIDSSSAHGCRTGSDPDFGGDAHSRTDIPPREAWRRGISRDQAFHFNASDPIALAQRIPERPWYEAEDFRTEGTKTDGKADSKRHLPPY